MRRTDIAGNNRADSTSTPTRKDTPHEQTATRQRLTIDADDIGPRPQRHSTTEKEHFMLVHGVIGTHPRTQQTTTTNGLRTMLGHVRPSCIWQSGRPSVERLAGLKTHPQEVNSPDDSESDTGAETPPVADLVGPPERRTCVDTREGRTTRFGPLSVASNHAQEAASPCRVELRNNAGRVTNHV